MAAPGVRSKPCPADAGTAKRLGITLDGWTALLGAVVFLHILISPFTKVEEGFPLHAAHDLLFHHGDLAKYDHFEFPGVVPRSFLGSVLLAALSAPAALLLSVLGAEKGAAQYAVRAALGLICVLSLARLRAAVELTFGRPVGVAFFALTALQFHVPYYASRTLPNTLALPLISLACAEWLARDRPARTVALLTFTVVVQRCDMLPLAGLIGLHMLLSGQRWLWPEGEVLWFNTILNRSSEWGVSVWHWYWTSALPRALAPALPLAVVGALLDRRAAQPVGVAAAYVMLYSYLPHKEARFLFPILPLFNIGAAVALTRIASSRSRSAAARSAHLGCCAALAAGFLMTVLMTAASRHNYPGGVALQRLHDLAAPEAARSLAAGVDLSVHIDTLPAMTGATRFFERGRPWVYSKVENLDVLELVQRNYTYLLSARPSMPRYHCVSTVEGYAGLDTEKCQKSLPPGAGVLADPKRTEHAYLRPGAQDQQLAA
ncbi:hypothetical protein WJX81_001546 [Elliptochloris bilobata]|uniref:Mannosyltransferase n=1 Tax=Elliptochloris bilobata TaxID=381761 RepID=A0AAW1R0P0_9CHLO